MKKEEKIFIGILLLILVIVVGVFIMSGRKDDSKKSEEKLSEEEEKNIIENYGIDVENGDVVIENGNGGKTIETKKQENSTDLVAASGEVKNKYEIKNVKVDVNGNRTSVKGSVKNNTNKEHKIVVQSKFYGNDNKVKGSGNVQIDNIKAGEERTFEIVIMGDMTGFTNKVTVEFTN